MNVVLQLGFAAEKAQDQLSQANEQLRVDVEKWHGAKNKEVCQLMRQFATNHMEYHQKVHTTYTHHTHCLTALAPMDKCITCGSDFVR